MLLSLLLHFISMHQIQVQRIFVSHIGACICLWRRCQIGTPFCFVAEDPGALQGPENSEQECPLHLSAANFTLAASLCSNPDNRAKCCRYINAFVAVSISCYANATSNLGVTMKLSEICLSSILEMMGLYGVLRSATVYCGVGTKILVTYERNGQTTITQMLQSPGSVDVVQNCRVPLAGESNCRKCLNAYIIYLHHFIGADDNLTLSTCRDAAFVALASQVDDASTVDIASCFFQVQGLNVPSEPSPLAFTPNASPSPLIAVSPSQVTLGIPLNKNHHHPYYLTLIPGIGIAITILAVIMLIVLIILIRRKSRELDESDNVDMKTSKAFPPLRAMGKLQDGPTSMFRKFTYKETKKATDNFSVIIGQGGFRTVYKAEFSDGLVVAVKRMSEVSEQAEGDLQWMNCDL